MEKSGVYFIGSIPHCHTENALKKGQDQEMWRRFNIDDKIGVSINDIIPHINIEMYGIATQSHFLGVLPFKALQ